MPTAADSVRKGGSRTSRRGSFLRAIARAYYIVYATAAYAAAKYGVTILHTRQGREIESDEFTHNAIADVVKALYTGNKVGNITPGSTPEIGSGNLSARDAAEYVSRLQRDRKDADYGPTKMLEPYSESRAIERLGWANMVAQDLEALI
jgi:hypothetical protein